jgi:excisionase family DNA binding protein
MIDQREKLLLTPEEAGERLGVGRTQIYALLRRGELLSVRIGRLRRIPVAALQRYVAELTAAAEAGEARSGAGATARRRDRGGQA